MRTFLAARAGGAEGSFAVLVLALVALGTPLGTPLGAQAPDVRASVVTVTVSPEAVTVGESFTVRLRVRAPKVATVRFPDVPESADQVDPVDPRSIEEGPPGNLLDRTAVYSFVAWDIGRRTPSFGPVVISVAGQQRSFAVGSQATVEVTSVLPADTTDHAPRDLRAPLPLPGKLWQYLVLGVTLAALLAWLWLRRRSRGRERPQGAVPEAWKQAKASFAALEHLALGEAGEPGRHVIAHVDVMRAYIARRFPELTVSLDASELVLALAKDDFPLPLQRLTMLVERDAVLRFAQSSVRPGEADALAAEARDIVALLQLAHEARLRAMERPPRPKRR